MSSTDPATMNTGPHAQAALERTGSGTYDDDDFEALSPSDQTHVTNSTSGPVHFVMTIEEPAAPPPPRRRGSATGAVGSNPLPPPPSRGEEGTSHLSPSQPQPAQPPTTRLRKLPRRMQSDPQLPTAHAVANRTLGERWIQKRYDAHRAAVVGARASVDNECPGSFRCLVSSGAPSVAASEESNEGDGDQETWNRQGKKKRPGSSSSRRSTSAGATVGSGSIINLKKRQMERDRQAQINARNQALLQKCQVVADVTAREYAREPAASHMRGALEHRARVRRVKQLGSIEVENRTLLRRIEAKSSPYSVVAMAADRAQNLRYLVNIAAHKSKYVDEMHAMRILDAEIDAAAATAAKLAAVPPTVMDPPRVPSATPSRPARVQSAPVGRTSSPTVPAGATSDPLSSPSPKKRPGSASPVRTPSAVPPPAFRPTVAGIDEANMPMRARPPSSLAGKKKPPPPPPPLPHDKKPPRRPATALSSSSSPPKPVASPSTKTKPPPKSATSRTSKGDARTANRKTATPAHPPPIK